MAAVPSTLEHPAEPQVRADSRMRGPSCGRHGCGRSIGCPAAGLVRARPRVAFDQSARGPRQGRRSGAGFAVTGMLGSQPCPPVGALAERDAYHDDMATPAWLGPAAKLAEIGGAG